jgi:hypothetical protein
MAIQLFLNLVFLISWKKSELTPSQNFLFLWEHYRTDLGLIFPPEEKFVSLCQRISLFISKTPDLEKAELPFLLGKQEFVDRNP